MIKRSYIYILTLMQMQLLEYSNGVPYLSNSYNTNEVLKREKNNETIYYLPCYINFKVKEITNLDIAGLKATIAGTLVFSFYYGKLDKSILDQFTGDEGSDEKYIFLQFGRQAPIELKPKQSGVTWKDKQKEQIMQYLVRREFTCALEGKVFYAPFEVINLYLHFTVQTIPLNPKANKGRKIDIKFNCMSSQSVITLQYSENQTFGNFNIARQLFDTKFSNSEKNPFKQIKQDNSTLKIVDKDQPDKLRHFQYVHFNIAMYKHPGVDLIQIFVPLWILGIINLFIFFQDRGLGGRIGAIATLTLSFIAFIPTINSKITKSPSIKMVEILVYMQAAASMLCLIQSFLGKDLTGPYNWATDGFFIAALTLNLLTVFIVLLMFIVYRCYHLAYYTKEKDEQKHKERVWKKQDWRSRDCDNQFDRFIRDGRISYL